MNEPSDRPMAATANRSDFRKLLCAVDGSDPACRAARVAASLALRCGADLTFVSVSREAALTDEVRTFLVDEGLKGQPQPWLSKDAGACLTIAVGIAREVGVECVERLVIIDQPEKGIIKTARNISADCLVLGRHGHRPVMDLFMGSVTRKVLDRTDLPVLLVR